MRLIEVTVRNYRSIESETKFFVEDLTTLVGPNNEGKSNLLRALDLAMSLIDRWSRLPDRLSKQTELTGLDARMLLQMNRNTMRSVSSDSPGFSWSDDYPIAKQEKRGSQPTVIRLKFELDESERADFTTSTGIKNNGVLPVEINLGRTNASFGVVKPGRGAATHRAKARAIAEFISQRLSLVSIPAVRTVLQARRLVNDLARLRMRELARSKEYLALIEEINLLRHNAVAEVGKGLVGSIQRYLPGVKGVEIVPEDFGRSDSVEDILMDDGSITSLSRKGDGVKSLVTLALIQELVGEQSHSHSFILAVDEPEAHLHSSAVHELQILFTKLSASQQVILATHNPIFVNRDHVGSNILVLGNRARPAQSIPQVREALGVQLHDNLSSAEVIVLVEGHTDAKLLPRLIIEFDPSKASDIRNQRVVFKAVTGAGKMRQSIVREKSTVCRIVAVLDDDAAGREEAKRLIGANLLSDECVFQLRGSGRKNTEIEDLLKPEIFLPAISKRFGRSFSRRHFSNRSRKWTDNLVEAAHSLGVAVDPEDLPSVAKTAVAEAISNTEGPIASEAAIEAITSLRDVIWGGR
ncbi:recombination protein F [Rhodococcus gordoniae]|uniref:Recombination protein F n=1 Tax=Rhodococcus gordoniae TaxID=223392 RepID=A0A379LTA0_9NOCA|nr:AAA family ATPase [Rhodococcus gordoniae]SUE13270.1 recombination protein F [Rhodococcus gordoniae]